MTVYRYYRQATEGTPRDGWTLARYPFCDRRALLRHLLATCPGATVLIESPQGEQAEYVTPTSSRECSDEEMVELRAALLYLLDENGLAMDDDRFDRLHRLHERLAAHFPESPCPHSFKPLDPSVLGRVVDVCDHCGMVRNAEEVAT